EDDIAFSGEAVAKGTDVDTYPMNLKDSQFSNGNTEQFSNVTIKVVKDGVLEITPLKVTVTITGNNDSVFYDGQTHTVSEFTSKIEGSDLYTEDDFEYDGNTLISETDVNRDENGDVTKYLMGLDAEKFVNNNNNFDPTFVIAEDGDGYLLINPLEASVTVQGDRVTAPYDNKLHEASGWKVLEETISNPLLSKDAIALNEGVSAYVARKDVGKDTMNLTTDDFYCKDGNFDVTITVEDGYVDITPIENIVVKINGTKATEEYNGQPHKAADFDVIISDASGLFQKTDITFSPQGKVTVDTNNVPYVEATDVKRDSEGNVVSYPMGLLKEMFSCTDERFKDVTFELESDGELTITPVSMNIAVEGDKKTYTYNGKDHTAEGYKATSTGEFFDETKVIYAKDKPVVTKKDKGTYSLELDENDFSYDDKNVDVTFSVQNGELVIDPLNITIDIVGDYIEKHIKFDGNEHTTKEAKPAHEKGYAVDYNDATAIIEDEDGNPVSQTISKADIEKIYDEAKIAFSGEAIAKGTLARAEAYTMGLTEGQFSNTDDNFVVKFVVKDGYLYIDSRGADAYKITISSQDVHSPYNGLEQSYTILAGVKDATATNPVAATLNKIAEMVDNFFSLKVGAEDGEKEVVVDGVTYVVHNLKVTATGKDYNETGYAFAFETAPTVTLKGEDVTGEFDIIPSLGKLYIDKVPVTITVDNKTKVQGAGDPTFTSKIEGLQGSDTLALGYTRATGEAPGNYQINVTATKEALESDYKNYTFTIVPGTLTITAPAPTPAPDDPTPTPTPTPTPIQDNPTPTAPAPTPVATPAPQAVLGAQRETGNGQAVLGARRAKTEDETNDMARVIAIVMSAVAAVMLMLAGKKKEDEEES
ncbi:MBG domain-containing protein, partial [Butyrivibrio sp. VCB2006]|uniref:MBG domain-containing protein n=1 Tax=Butyrivibrio sp. VCB2006 TaxID=1280679 RepID=UPI00056916E2